MKLRVWNDFAKRENSTKLPDLNTGSELDVYLKDDTSLENPVFIISGNIYTWAYCYLPSFSRYYFITDLISISRNQYEIHARIDAAASFRAFILNYTAYVERAASAYDVMVPDGLLSSQQDVISKSVAGSNSGLDENGLFVVPVSGKNGVKLYAFSSLASAAAFYNGTLYKNPKTNNPLSLNEIDTLITTVGFHTFNAQDYMGALMWLPIPAGYMGAVSSVAVGMWELDFGGYNVLDDDSMYVTIPIAAPGNIYSDFRKGDPRFSKYSLWLPGVGLVGINSLDAAEDDLYCDMALDFYTGAVSYRVYHGSGADIATFNGQLGVQIPTGKTNINVGSLVSTAIGTAAAVAGAATGGAAVAAGAMGAVSVASAILDPQSSIQGGAGNKAVIEDRPDIYLSCENYGSKEFPVYEAGRPLCQNVQLGTLSGYVKCGNASLSIPALDHIRRELNNMLNSGIYIE